MPYKFSSPYVTYGQRKVVTTIAIHTLLRLLTIWKEAKKMFLNAPDCKDDSQDKNAWCDNVVRPLIYLAIDLYSNGRYYIQPLLSSLKTIANPPFA